MQVSLSRSQSKMGTPVLGARTIRRNYPHPISTKQRRSAVIAFSPEPSPAASSSSAKAPETKPSETNSLLEAYNSAAAASSSGGSQNQTQPPPAESESALQMRWVHILLLLLFSGGALFATLSLQFTSDLSFTGAFLTVIRRTVKSDAFRQLVVISCSILAVRFGLNGALRALTTLSSSPVQWDKTKMYYVLREVYQPLEVLLLIAALCTIADTFVPSLVSVPKATVSQVVRTVLGTSFVVGLSTVAFNLKSRLCKENAWQAEMRGDITQQRRWEAYDKLGTFVIYVLTFVLGLQAIGLEVTSVLAIGGVGGLAIGLAGREICENLLNGFLIMSTTPFEVGDEIHFFHSNKQVEGFVIDIGWYRTQIRSFEREVFVIPNSVFSKNIVLNISRRNKEHRFHEILSIRVQDVHKANAIVKDIRSIVRNDTRIVNKLHRRIFLDKITRDDCKIYISLYVEAQNRDAFMGIKQDLLLAFVDVVERNGARLATPQTMVDLEKDVASLISTFNPTLAGIAAAQTMAYAQQQQQQQGMAGLRMLPESVTTIAAEDMLMPRPSSSPSPSSLSSTASASSASAVPLPPVSPSPPPLTQQSPASSAVSASPPTPPPIPPSTPTPSPSPSVASASSSGSGPVTQAPSKSAPPSAVAAASNPTPSAPQSPPPLPLSTSTIPIVPMSASVQPLNPTVTPQPSPAPSPSPSSSSPPLPAQQTQPIAASSSPQAISNVVPAGPGASTLSSSSSKASPLPSPPSSSPSPSAPSVAATTTAAASMFVIASQAADGYLSASEDDPWNQDALPPVLTASFEETDS